MFHGAAAADNLLPCLPAIECKYPRPLVAARAPAEQGNLSVANTAAERSFVLQGIALDNEFCRLPELRRRRRRRFLTRLHPMAMAAAMLLSSVSNSVQSQPIPHAHARKPFTHVPSSIHQTTSAILPSSPESELCCGALQADGHKPACDEARTCTGKHRINIQPAHQERTRSLSSTVACVSLATTVIADSSSSGFEDFLCSMRMFRQTLIGCAVDIRTSKTTEPQ